MTNNPSPASRSGTQGKQYVVARQFTDKNGKSWQPGQQYQGATANDAEEQLAQGNIHEQGPGGQGVPPKDPGQR